MAGDRAHAGALDRLGQRLDLRHPAPLPARDLKPDARLAELLDRLAARRHVRHAILALARDGTLHWSGAAGDARPDSPFFIASIDKLFTAVVVLKLHEQGRLALDEFVCAYLPAIRGLHRFRGIDYSDTITVRHLLGHTSGLADWLEDRPRGGTSLVERIVRKGDRAMDLDEILAIVRDDLAPHFPPGPLHAPRPRVRYSDTNFLLLTALIEALTRRPLHEVHEALLFRPLGLRHTWLAGRSQPLEHTREPTTLWAGEKPLGIPRLLASIGGIYSTAEDLLKFLQAVVHGTAFDSPATAALMGSRWNRFAFALDRAALRAPTWPIEYGLGMMRFHDPVLGFLSRLPLGIASIPPVIGHSGSTGSWLFHCPELDVSFAGTVDEVSAGPVPFRLVPRVLRIMNGHSR